MAYERDDDRIGRGPMGNRHEPRARDHDRSGGQYGSGPDRNRGGRGPGGPRGQDGRYGRQPQGYEYEDRGFFERSADEVRSWFGDEEAERRRRYDEQYGERDDQARDAGGRGDRARSYGETRHDASDAYGAGGPRNAGGRYTGGGGGVGAPGFGGQGRADFGGGPVGGSDFGAGRGAGATMGYGLGAGQDREQWGHDPSYRSWRDRQVESLDRDYDEYRREHQSKFESEFSTWRTGRQTQRDALARVQEHQEVVGSDGSHVGTVDKIRGDQIILTKNDQDAGGHHHAIPSSWIQTVDDKVTLRKTAAEAKAHWRDVERTSAFGDQDRDGERDRDRAPWSSDSRAARTGSETTNATAASDDSQKARSADRTSPNTY